MLLKWIKREWRRVLQELESWLFIFLQPPQLCPHCGANSPSSTTLAELMVSELLLWQSSWSFPYHIQCPSSLLVLHQILQPAPTRGLVFLRAPLTFIHFVTLLVYLGFQNISLNEPLHYFLKEKGEIISVCVHTHTSPTCQKFPNLPPFALEAVVIKSEVIHLAGNV